MTWQPAVADIFEGGGIGLGSGVSFRYLSLCLWEIRWRQNMIASITRFVQGPTDQPTNQSSISYNLGWRHTLRGGFVSAQVYRNRFVGQSVRAAVPLRPN